MQGRRLLKMARKNIAEIVQPEIEKQGFKMEEQNIEGDKSWVFYKNGSEKQYCIVVRVAINNTINMDFYVSILNQFKIGEVDPNGDVWKEITGYPFDSEESFKEQLKFLLNLTLEKGIPKMNEFISKEQANKVEKQ